MAKEAGKHSVFNAFSVYPLASYNKLFLAVLFLVRMRSPVRIRVSAPTIAVENSLFSTVFALFDNFSEKPKNEVFSEIGKKLLKNYYWHVPTPKKAGKFPGLIHY